MPHPILSEKIATRPGACDFLFIHPVPTGEKCIQINENLVENMLECTVYIDQLIRVFGAPPPGACFFIIENIIEDTGIYYDVAIRYKDEEAAIDYALDVQNGCEYWDGLARRQLIEAGYSLLINPSLQLRCA